jgi:molecular chaperone GrpE
MSESAPPGVAPDAAVGPAQALTPEAIAGVLADFRGWLESAAANAGAAPAAHAEEVDLHTLLGQFLALRHEVNLQTRAARNQQEQNAETLRQLSQALDLLRQAPAPQMQPDAQGPLLKTLLDVYDALALAAREVKRGEEALGGLLDRAASETPQPTRSLWSRWFGTAEAAAPPPEALGKVRQSLGALVTGYTMSLQRLERALRQHGLEVMSVVGQAFDPERMEVVEVVAGSGRPSGEVIDEVRRGYLWNGRVFRYAQVRVARG